MGVIIPTFEVKNSAGGVSAFAQAFLGNVPEHAFEYLGEATSNEADEFSYKNIGVTGAAKFTKKSSLDRNLIVVPNPTNIVSLPMTLSFWMKPSDYFSSMPWGMDATAVLRTIVGNRQASITSTDASKYGFSFGIERSTTPTQFNCKLNVNGTILNGANAGIGDFDEWHFVIISISSGAIAFSVIVPPALTFPNTTNIYNASPGSTTGLAGLSNQLIIGADLYTKASDGSDFYFDGWLSNLKIYSSGAASTTSGVLMAHFSAIVTHAWIVPTLEETQLTGATLPNLSAAYPLQLNANAVIIDRHLNKRSFVTSGFSGDALVDYSTDTPIGFLFGPNRNDRALVMNGSSYLKQRGYSHDNTAVDYEDQFAHFIEDYCFEFWFKCEQLPMLSEPVQILVSKSEYDPTTPEDFTAIVNGLSVFLQYDEPTDSVYVRFISETGIDVSSIKQIQLDTWYHVAIDSSASDTPLASGGTPNFTQTYIFVSEEAVVPTTYEAFSEIDPTGEDGIGVTSVTAFADFPLTIGAGCSVVDYYIPPINFPSSGATLDINLGDPTQSTITITATNFQNAGVRAPFLFVLESPPGSATMIQYIPITAVAGDTLTFNHTATPLLDPAGVTYLNATEGTFQADYYDGGNEGKYAVWSAVATADPEFIGLNFIGKIFEFRIWKKARKFNQIYAYRFNQFNID